MSVCVASPPACSIVCPLIIHSLVRHRGAKFNTKCLTCNSRQIVGIAIYMHAYKCARARFIIIDIYRRLGLLGACAYYSKW